MKPLAAVLFILLLVAVFPLSKSFSNGLAITNVSYSINIANDGTGTVTFDLSWQNSWRNSEATAKNWDAAWVFVKWRACSYVPPTSQPFDHGTVSSTVGDHIITGTGLEATKSDGTAGIDSDNKGLMLRSATNLSSGAVSSSITIKVTNFPVSGTLLDLRVYGIEMVFVPQNSFVIGDGDGYLLSDRSFTSTAVPAAVPNKNCKAIINEAAQSVFEATATFCSIGDCYLTATYPKGYNAFYMMKYEISQGQYADFLNAVNSAGQSAHYPNTNQYRHTIVNNITPPTQYSSERPDRACNYLSWVNVSAYLDWAALRPLTELEYEKSCRGTELGVPYQKPWGIATGTPAAAGGISGSENGTETITTSGANVNVNSVNWTTGDGNSIQGPLRCGIFATSATSVRLQTGMSFYGAMDLAGNVIEYYISVTSGISGNPSASGVTPGDGMLNASNGSHDNGSWPVAASPGNNLIRRGGSWASANGTTAASTIETNISHRPTAPVSAAADNTSGGRGGR